MSRSIRKETSSLAFGTVGRCGGSSAGFVVAALNAASAASREVVVLRVLSEGIIYVLALGLHFLKRNGGQSGCACANHQPLVVAPGSKSVANKITRFRPGQTRAILQCFANGRLRTWEWTSLPNAGGSAFGQMAEPHPSLAYAGGGSLRSTARVFDSEPPQSGCAY